MIKKSRIGIKQELTAYDFGSSKRIEKCLRQLLTYQDGKIGLKKAEENLRVTNNKYNVLMALLADLLDAQLQWKQAKSNLIEAQTQYKIYETEYLRAIGKLNHDFSSDYQ